MSEENTESEALVTYLRRKSQATGKKFKPGKSRLKKNHSEDSETPFSPGRDPEGIGNAIDALTQELGWKAPLSQSEVLVGWEKIVGPDIAAKTRPLDITEATLTVQCESTAWATQLRLMHAEVLTKLAAQFPESNITAIRFLGPNAPSWKRGPKSIPGRGPRDTYG